MDLNIFDNAFGKEKQLQMKGLSEAEKQLQLIKEYFDRGYVRNTKAELHRKIAGFVALVFRHQTVQTDDWCAYCIQVEGAALSAFWVEGTGDISIDESKVKMAPACFPIKEENISEPLGRWIAKIEFAYSNQ